MFLIISPGFSWISLFVLLSFYFEYKEKKDPNPAYKLYSLVWMNIAEFLFWLKLNILIFACSEDIKHAIMFQIELFDL